MTLGVITITQVRNGSGSDCGVSRESKETCTISDLCKGRDNTIY